jgi:hypothetical protein
MNSPIPWSFIRERMRLSWLDASIGYREKLFEWTDVVELACKHLTEGEDNALVVELAGITKDEANRIGELLEQLARDEANDAADSKKKWLYLSLAWLFENRDSVANPLSEVERLYADFDYPNEVACFVPYMPTTDGYDPTTHSAAENHTRLIKNWEDYLERTRVRLSPPEDEAR